MAQDAVFLNERALALFQHLLLALVYFSWIPLYAICTHAKITASMIVTSLFKRRGYL